MAKAAKPDDAALTIEEQLQTVREDIAKLGKLLGDLAQAKLDDARKGLENEAEGLLGRSQQAASNAAGMATDSLGAIETRIREKPVQSALIALLVGIFIGSLSRR